MLKRRPTLPRPRPIYPDERLYLDEALDPYIVAQQLRAAGCSVFERRVVMMFLVHRSRTTVARKLKLPRAVISIALRAAIEKLQHWRETRKREKAFDGWRAVYLEDVNRWAYEEEHHCPPGQEACAKDGLCKYRWYLIGEQLL